MRSHFPCIVPVRPHVRPSSCGGRGPHARAVRGRVIHSTKVTALPESLGQCKLLETLCVPRPPGRRARLRRCRRYASARALPRRALGRTTRRWTRRRRRRCRSSASAEPRARIISNAADRRACGVGRKPPGAAARLARRDASNTDIAALPSAVDWPSLQTL
jgi:hypothetical protein